MFDEYQLNKDKIIGASVTFKLDENGDIVEDKISQFTMEKSDKLIACPNTKCQAESDGNKCEL